MIMQNNNSLPWLLWQDQDIFLINKPAGLLSIQDGYDRSAPNLRSILNEYGAKAWIVHRLDKETSGVMIVAKNAAAHRALSWQFENRKIEKEYHAIIVGVPSWHEIIADTPLLVNGDRKHRTVGDLQKGKPAKTVFSALKSAEKHTLIQASPLSGYRHQIRAHLRELNFAILNDDLYAVSGSKVPDSSSQAITRLALHANCIRFEHPSTGEQVKAIAPYPLDFADALQELKLDQLPKADKG